MFQLTPEQRAQAMRSNRGRTKPELRFAKAIWSRGYRYFTSDGWKRLSGQVLPGNPDLIFPRCKLAVFIDGCFWHGCPTHFTKPLGNTKDFWESKLESTIARDKRNTGALEGLGWRVVRFWEHEVRPKTLKESISKLERVLNTTMNE